MARPFPFPALLIAPVLLLSACAGTPPVHADPAALRLPASGPVEVSWSDPARFTERSCRLDERDEWVRRLATHARESAERRLPQGARLELRLIDIDRAGECRPAPHGEELRVLSEATPPRIVLDYRFTGPDGRVREEIAVRLVDLAYLSRPRLGVGGGDPLLHEKRLLDDWLRRVADSWPASRGDG